MHAEFEKEVIDRLARIETKSDDLTKKLYGNGQPGDIQRLQSDVKNHGEFINNLKGHMRGKIVFFSAAVSGGILMLYSIARTVVEHVFSSK